jgi:hypothetical protein
MVPVSVCLFFFRLLPTVQTTTAWNIGVVIPRTFVFASDGLTLERLSICELNVSMLVFVLSLFLFVFCSC